MKALERTRIQGVLINLQPDRPPRKGGKPGHKSK
jgi:ATP-dependent RNA helicase DeaD